MIERQNSVRKKKGDIETKFCRDRGLVTERQLCENRELVTTDIILLGQKTSDRETELYGDR